MPATVNGSLALAWVERFARDVDARQAELTDLDRRAGDGDFGANIASALRRVAEALPSVTDAGFGSVFSAASSGFLATGGTSGPLFGMWFRELARCTDSGEADLAQLSAGVSAGLAVVQRLGGARQGDKTMVDAMVPAAAALEELSAAGAPLEQAVAEAARRAAIAAAGTAGLVASRGRASYVGEVALGVEDPGAVTVAMFFEAGASAVAATH